MKFADPVWLLLALIGCLLFAWLQRRSRAQRRWRVAHPMLLAVLNESSKSARQRLDFSSWLPFAVIVGLGILAAGPVWSGKTELRKPILLILDLANDHEFTRVHPVGGRIQTRREARLAQVRELVKGVGAQRWRLVQTSVLSSGRDLSSEELLSELKALEGKSVTSLERGNLKDSGTTSFKRDRSKSWRSKLLGARRGQFGAAVVFSDDPESAALASKLHEIGLRGLSVSARQGFENGSVEFLGCRLERAGDGGIDSQVCAFRVANDSHERRGFTLLFDLSSDGKNWAVESRRELRLAPWSQKTLVFRADPEVVLARVRLESEGVDARERDNQIYLCASSRRGQKLHVTGQLPEPLGRALKSIPGLELVYGTGDKSSVNLQVGNFVEEFDPGLVPLLFFDNRKAKKSSDRTVVRFTERSEPWLIGPAGFRAKIRDVGLDQSFQPIATGDLKGREVTVVGERQTAMGPVTVSLVGLGAGESEWASLPSFPLFVEQWLSKNLEPVCLRGELEEEVIDAGDSDERGDSRSASLERADFVIGKDGAGSVVWRTVNDKRGGKSGAGIFRVNGTEPRIVGVKNVSILPQLRGSSFVEVEAGGDVKEDVTSDGADVVTEVKQELQQQGVEGEVWEVSLRGLCAALTLALLGWYWRGVWQKVREVAKMRS